MVNEKTGARRRRRWVLWGGLAVLLAPVALLGVAMLIVDSRGIPAGARETPGWLADAAPEVRRQAYPTSGTLRVPEADRPGFWQEYNMAVLDIQRGPDGTVIRSPRVEEFLEGHGDALARFYAQLADPRAVRADADSHLGSLAGLARDDAMRELKLGHLERATEICELMAGFLARARDPEEWWWDGNLMLRGVGEIGVMRLEAGPLARPEAARLLGELDTVVRARTAPEIRDRALRRQVAAHRPAIVRRLEQPWWTDTYGFMTDSESMYIRIGGVRVPEPVPFAEMAVRAMRRRSRVPEMLPAWDVWQREAIEKGEGEIPPSGDSSDWIDPPAALAGTLVGAMNIAAVSKSLERSALSQCNLLRAGLTLIVDPVARPPEDLPGEVDPTSVWWDPWSGGALQVGERDGKRIVYSIERSVQDDGGEPREYKVLELAGETTRTLAGEGIE